MSHISLLIMPLCESHSDYYGHNRSWEEVEETGKHQV